MIKPHILLIGTVWPEPSSSAAGSRTLQLIDVFLKSKFQVTFACAAAKSNFSYLPSIGVNEAVIELNSSSFDSFVIELNPSVVIFDRFMIEEQFGWRVAENCPDALRLLDTIDLHCLRLARQQAFRDKREFVLENLLTTDVAKREIASIYRCDCTLMISDFEMTILKNLFKINDSLLYYIPFLLDNISEDVASKLPTFKERKHFVTIGNFLHEPNWNSVQYLKQEIWPLIRKQLPEAELHVYGAYASAKVDQLNNIKEGFIIKGRANDAHEVMQSAKICLAPLRFGAGLKGKLIDAMQCGTPSVTTSIGSEGMNEGLEWGGAICNNPSYFAMQAVTLYCDEQKWMKAQTNGFQIINQVFDRERFSDAFVKHLQKLKTNLTEHRLNNFIGSMLMHHTISGTKYMSRWIEEKNKK